MNNEQLPQLIFFKREVDYHAKKIIEILELDIVLRKDLLILNPPDENSSEIHKMFYNEFYDYWRGGKNE